MRITDYEYCNKDIGTIKSTLVNLSYGRAKMIDVTKNGERIKISFSYNPDYIAKIKTIEGYRWHPEEKCWSVPRKVLNLKHFYQFSMGKIW